MGGLVKERLILTVICLVILLPAPFQAADAKPWDPAMGTATITGMVKFDGKQPRSRPIDMAGADEKCAELHGGVRQKRELRQYHRRQAVTLLTSICWPSTM